MGSSLTFHGTRNLLIILFAALQLHGVAGEWCSITRACCVPHERVQVDENNPVGFVFTNVTINKAPLVILNQSRLAVVGNTLQLIESLDYESLETPVIFVKLKCGPLAEPLTLQIEVINVNDNPPTFPKKELNLSISESFPVGEIWETVRANDLDGDPIFYSLDPTTDGAEYFDLKTQNTPAIILSKTIDYEEAKKLKLILLAKENLNDSLARAAVTIDIAVVDEDNKPPVFMPCSFIANDVPSICLRAVYVGNVTENRMEIGALHLDPCSVHSVDGDSGINAKIGYRIIAGNPDNAFKMNAASGEITMEKAVSSLSPIVLTVMSYQENDRYKFSTTTVTINVLKANLCPPKFMTATYDGTIQGSSVTGSIVTGQGSTTKPLAVQAQDCDYPGNNNPSIKYEITPSDYFTINRDGFIFTKTVLPIADSVFDLKVTARDEEFGETATTNVKVQVVSDAPTTTTQGTGPSKPPNKPPGTGPTTTGASTPSKAPPTGTQSSTTQLPGPPGSTTAKPPAPESGPTTAPTTVRTTTTHGTGPSKPPTEPPGTGPTTTGASTPSKAPPTGTQSSTARLPGPPGSTTAKPPAPESGPTTTTPHVSGSTSTAVPGPPGPIPTASNKPPNGPGTGPPTSCPVVNPLLMYEAKHMVALGVPLAVLLIISLIIMGILLKIHMGRMEGKQLKSPSGGHSNQSDTIQFVNEGYVGETKSKSHKADGSQKPSWPSRGNPGVVESALLAAVLDPMVENASSTSASGSQTGPTPQGINAASSSLGEADSDTEVKSILTKERKSDEGYKAVWFKEDIEPEANEERVIESHDDDEEPEGGERGRGDGDGDGEGPGRRVAFA
ncbi:cadherin-related family member 5-like isoform X1 [Heptranchias perlo]|uniref:cadherin-related family member 5-like isoform X1 n=1 Tax=Heptranchias perlo TaxID=212740 RepID=UPI003559D0AA